MASVNNDLGSAEYVDDGVFSGVSTLCEKGVQDGTFPGCVISVAVGGRELYKRAFGVKSLIREKDEAPLPMHLSTVFDIASVTNVLVTTTILMRLVQSGRIGLDDRVLRYIQSFGVNGKSTITIRHLLNHSSGLPSWVPYFEELIRLHEGERRGILTSSGAKEYVYNAINRAQLKFEPGTKQVYSDVGFILLGHLIEIVTGTKLDRAAQQYVFQPLGLKSTSFIDLAMIRRRGIHPVKDMIAPTEDCQWRGRVLCGEVFDDNAWAMGGITGNSGVFSSQADLHTFAVKMLRSYTGQDDFVSRDVVREFWGDAEISAGDGWRLGWDSPSKENALSETKLSPNAVGQNGASGCSIWLEPERGIDIVLLSNKVHPSRSNKKLRTFRPILIDAILTTLEKL